MARETKIVLTDDIDGSVAEETVKFSIGEDSYEIELSAANAQKFRESLKPFIENARRSYSGASSMRRIAPGLGSSSSRSAKMRRWAIDNGYKVSDRGRIPAAIMEAYRAATTQVRSPSDITDSDAEPILSPHARRVKIRSVKE